MYQKEEGTKKYGSAMLIIGIYEYQVNKLTKGFIQDMSQYLAEAWGRENAKVPIPQLRTIPVGIKVKQGTTIANYDDIKRGFQRQVFCQCGRNFRFTIDYL